jgi:hypothetical protein
MAQKSGNMCVLTINNNTAQAEKLLVLTPYYSFARPRYKVNMELVCCQYTYLIKSVTQASIAGRYFYNSSVTF